MVAVGTVVDAALATQAQTQGSYRASVAVANEQGGVQFVAQRTLGGQADAVLLGPVSAGIQGRLVMLNQSVGGEGVGGLLVCQLKQRLHELG